MSNSVLVRAADVPWQSLEARAGIYTKSMTFGDPATRRYLRVQIGKTGPSAMSPRHKHTFDQLRYFVEGDAKFGNVIYHPGDCVYFPEGVPYGPQVGYNDLDSIQIVLQWGGPSGVYYPSGDEQGAAKRALDTAGEFRDGIYFPHAGKPQDGFEALLEHISGAPVEYAAPRYDAPVRMRTEAFAQLPDPLDERIEWRRLARFNECGPDVSLVNLRAGATLAADVPKADRLSTLISGRATYGDRDVDAISCLHVPQGASSESLTAIEDSTVLVVTFG
jgi:hypothetical protein